MNFVSYNSLKHFEKVALVCDNHLYHGGNKTTGLETLEFIKEVIKNAFVVQFFSVVF